MFLLAQLPTETLLEQLKNGVALLVLGMAIVFVFLTILVFTTKAMSKIVMKLEKKKPVAQKSEQATQNAATAAAGATTATVATEAEVALAIAAAMAKSTS